jgi:rod shape determining protein RodA
VGIDWWLIASAVALTLIGLGTIYSSHYGETTKFFKDQLLNIGVGLVPLSIFLFVHPRIWAKAMPFVYGLNLLALFAVKFVGKTVNGAERWVKIGPIQIQPSEMAKILLVITLASFYASRQDRIKEFGTFALGLLHMAVPIVFVFIQPHLGASLLLIAVWAALSLVAGVPPKFLVLVVGLVVSIAALVVFVTPVRKAVLKPYQEERVLALIYGGNKTAEEKKQGVVKGDDYQVQQGFYAIANGGLAGTGFLKGTQKLNVPEQETDFIFTVFSEEFGLLGSVALLGLFALLFYRLWLGLLVATDFYYQMLLAGILTVFAFHLFVNVGMVLKIFPVVGLWCPFLSKGGTAIWLCMSLIGLAVNVRARERAVLF